MKERRLHRRASFNGKVDSTENLKAKALDISLSGLKIVCDKNLQEGTILFLMVALDCKGIIKVIGRVAWITSVKQNKFQCGIEFFSINQYEQNKIQEFINTKFMKN